MNEKIKELAEQAGLYAFVSNEGADPDIELFAELIVRECIGITDVLINRNVDGSWTSNELYTDYNGALFEVKRRIQESFGVEE
jgi:hypothetical protein